MGKLTEGMLHFWAKRFVSQFSGWMVEERIRALEYQLTQEKLKLQSKEDNNEVMQG